MLNLVFYIIRKDHYFDHVVPNWKAPKEEFFGHTDLILHESEIRRKTGVLARLRNKSILRRWMIELHAWINQTKTSVVSAWIDKVALSRRYAHPFDPYDSRHSLLPQTYPPISSAESSSSQMHSSDFRKPFQTSRSYRADRIPTDPHTGQSARTRPA